MAVVTHFLRISDAIGNNPRIISNVTALECAVTVNQSTQLHTTLPYAQLSGVSLVEGAWIELWRSIDGGPYNLFSDTVWLADEYTDSGTGAGRTIDIGASRAIDLLDRRIIAYSSAGTYSRKTGAGDSLIVTIANENYGSSALDANRNTSAYLTVDTALGTAPSTTVELNQETLLDAFRSICQDCAKRGTPLYFDVLLDATARKLILKTFVSARGKARTLILNENNGTLANIKVVRSYREEKNYLYVNGKGTGDNKIGIQVSDSVAYGRGPFARREARIKADSVSTTTGLTWYGNAQLRKNRAKLVFTADIINSGKIVLGREYDLGDVLTPEVRSTKYNSFVDTVSLSIQNGMESVRSSIRGEVEIS